MTTTFKSYSEKSKARRALVQVYGISKENADTWLMVVDGKNGFHLKDGVPYLPDADEGVAQQFGEERTVPAAVLPTETEVQALAPQAEDTPDEAPAPAASAFAGFAMSQLCAAAGAALAAAEKPSAATETQGLRIEKNREERNGVKMRSTGGACRQVWDALQSMMLHDEATGVASIPTVADIKKLATEKGWNVNNASIEYYQWRKFNGITGRGKKTV